MRGSRRDVEASSPIWVNRAQPRHPGAAAPISHRLDDAAPRRRDDASATMSEIAAQPPVGRRPVQRPVAPQAPAQGRRLARRHRARRRRPEPARDRRRRLAVGPLGPDQGRSRPATSSRGCSSRRGQTVFAGLSYYGILRAAYPGQVEFWPIVTAYAVGVAMNNFLPANIGTFATLVMFVRHHPGLHVPRGARRLPRPEDLLHGRRHVRLPLPLPVRAGLVRREPRQHLRGSGDGRS